MFDIIPTFDIIGFNLNNSYITENSFIYICSSQAERIVSTSASNIINGRCTINIFASGNTVNPPQIRFMLMN